MGPNKFFVYLLKYQENLLNGMFKKLLRNMKEIHTIQKEYKNSGADVQLASVRRERRGKNLMAWVFLHETGSHLTKEPFASKRITRPCLLMLRVAVIFFSCERPLLSWSLRTGVITTSAIVLDGEYKNSSSRAKPTTKYKRALHYTSTVRQEEATGTVCKNWTV